MPDLYVQPRPAPISVGSLAGKTAFVTGASRGVGAAVALLLADAGCAVVVHYRSKVARAEQVAQEVRRRGGRALTVGADLTDAGAVGGALDRVRDAFGALDALILNASGGMEKNAPSGYSLRLNRDAQRDLVERSMPRMAPGGRYLFVTSHWAHFHGELPVHPAYEVVAVGKKAGEVAVREMVPELTVRELGLVVVSGDMIEGTITPKLLARIDPDLKNERQVKPRRLPTTEEFAQVVVDAAFDPALASGTTVFVGEGH